MTRLLFISAITKTPVILDVEKPALMLHMAPSAVNKLLTVWLPKRGLSKKAVAPFLTATTIPASNATMAVGPCTPV